MRKDVIKLQCLLVFLAPSKGEYKLHLLRFCKSHLTFVILHTPYGFTGSLALLDEPVDIYHSIPQETGTGR